MWNEGHHSSLNTNRAWYSFMWALFCGGCLYDCKSCVCLASWTDFRIMKNRIYFALSFTFLNFSKLQFVSYLWFHVSNDLKFKKIVSKYFYTASLLFSLFINRMFVVSILCWQTLKVSISMALFLIMTNDATQWVYCL